MIIFAGGLGVCITQFFSVKYVVFYGLKSKMAVADNLDVDGAPICVYANHRFTTLWKCVGRNFF